MLAGGIYDGRTVHQVSAQHLVLDLDLVEGKEERVAAEEQLGANRFRPRVDQAGVGERAATLFLSQRRVLLDTYRQGSRK